MKIILYGSLSRNLGKELEVEVKEGTTLRELLEDLSKKEPEIRPDNPNILIFINDAESSLLGGLSYKLKNTDKVSILPIAHGGKY